MSWRTAARADQQIEDLFEDGWRRFGEAQATEYLDGLYDLFDLIVSQPRMNRLRDEFDPPVRIHPYRSHVVAYVEEENGVLIVAIKHARQDWQYRLGKR